MASAASSARSETSFPFPSASFLPPSPTPASLLGQSARVPKRPTLQIPGREGGRGDRIEPSLEPQQTSAITRSGPGQTASGSPPRPPASPTLSPQLLGGHIGPDANFLITRQDSMKDYKSGQQEAMKAQLQGLVSSSPSPIRVPSLPPSFGSKRQDSVLITPASERSHYSYTEIPETSTSEASTASSFAYHLRRKEPDTRLLKKKSKPSQHLIKKPLILKPVPGPARSPSFYKPKVVDDTGFVESTTAGIRAPSPPDKPFALTLTKSMRVDSGPPIKPLRKAQTFESQPAAKPSLMSLQIPTPAKKSPISFSRSSSSLQRPEAPTRQLRFQSPQILEFSHSESANTLAPMLPPKDRPRRPSFAVDQIPEHKPRFHAVTPIKLVPGTPSKRSFHPDGSYFPILGIDAMPDRGFVPPRSPAPLTPAESKTEAPELPQPESAPMPKRSLSLIKRVTMSSPIRPSIGSMKPRKQSRMFSIFRKTQFEDEVIEENTGIMPSAPPSPFMTPATPGIKIHSPVEPGTDKRRMSSIVPDLSYFTRPKARRNQSDSSTSRSPGTSPMNTVADDDLPAVPRFGGRTRGHNRSSSEQLSPRTTSRGRSRSRHTPMLDHLGGESVQQRSPSSDESPRLTVPPTPEHRRIEGSGSARAVDQVTVPSPGDDIESPPAVDTADMAAVVKQNVAVKKKASVFRGFFLDLRKMSSADKISLGEDVPITQADRHRFAMIPKVSLPVLKFRASMATFSTRRFRRNGGRLRQTGNAETAGRNGKDNSSDEDAQTSSDQAAPNSSAVEQPHENVEPPKITAADLVVTHFETTPFSQRYHDARKAEVQHIRSLIEDTLDEDDEEDDDIVLGFEQNVPEHFPNSPLCPLHPKHKSGGKAICPQHRRYRKSNAARVVKVGPARSNRVINYTMIAPRESQQASPQTTVFGNPPWGVTAAKGEEVARVGGRIGSDCAIKLLENPPDNTLAMREEAARARRRMGSDGASMISSASSKEWSHMRKAVWAKNSWTAAESRGRTLQRNAWGSARRPRRRRIHRR